MQTNAVSAEFGRLGGGVINLITKSGSNTLHATAFGNSAATASWMRPTSSPTAPGHEGQFQAQPVRRQRRRSADAARLQWRRPDVLLRQLRGPAPGDRARSRPSRCRCRSGAAATSRTCATPTAQPIIIYDPATTRPDPGNPGSFIRDPFPGNIIPPERISAVGRAMARYWPLPNTTPSNAFTQANNYSSQARSRATATASIRASTTSSATSGARSSATPTPTKTARCSTASGTSPARRAATARPTRRRRACRSTTTTSRSTLITAQRALRTQSTLRRSHAAVGGLRPRLGRLRQQRRPDRAGRRVSPRQRPGLPVARAEHVHRPRHRPDDAPVQLHRHEDPVESHHQVRHGLPQVHAQLHPAVLPVGPVRLQQRAVDAARPQRQQLTQGFALASMLLGIPSFGQISHNPSPASASSYWASTSRTTGRWRSNLTINLGLRYEFDVPRTERFDRLSYFDSGVTSPLAGGVPANPFFDPRRPQRRRWCSWTRTTAARWTPISTTSVPGSVRPGT